MGRMKPSFLILRDNFQPCPPPHPPTTHLLLLFFFLVGGGSFICLLLFETIAMPVIVTKKIQRKPESSYRPPLDFGTCNGQVVQNVKGWQLTKGVGVGGGEGWLELSKESSCNLSKALLTKPFKTHNPNFTILQDIKVGRMKTVSHTTNHIWRREWTALLEVYGTKNF